jgi:hypothetical protein
VATEQFRKDAQETLATWLADAFPDVQAFYENGPMADESTVGPLWIDCTIRWYGAKFVTVGGRPRGRHTGVFATNVYHREGEGTALPDQVLDAIKELLRGRRLGSATLYMPQRTIPTVVNGWHKVGLITPFTLDDA